MSPSSPPHTVRYGSAAPPPPHREFQGASGMWHCEHCDTEKMLSPSTKSWKCPKCHKTMYTLPPEECPLDTFCPCCCWDTLLGGGGGTS
mmetsp:Transcript_31223/g.45710  ORF Transcript_31223/g.45710 Transcript_31223/m.45710 type:complete len:89 (-) Transcript_31223:251-517(-)